jgi:hypothetical protein
MADDRRGMSGDSRWWAIVTFAVLVLLVGLTIWTAR